MKKTLVDLAGESLAGAVVALRADFNVPLDGGCVTDGARIERTIPTLDHLLAAGAKVVVLSHLGRPGGRARVSLTLDPVARILDDLLAAPVGFLPHCAGPVVGDAVAAMTPGQVLLLENTRFLPGETANAPDLAADWASWADHFVMDAFGTVHRAHASTEELPRAVRAKGGEAVAGRLVERELAVLGGLLEAPRGPFVAILGGAKISGKIDVIEVLLPQVDGLLVGGAMANTFLMAMGMETGTSLVEPEKTEVAFRLMETSADRLVLPVDCVTARSIETGALRQTVDRTDVSRGGTIGDIGPVTVDLFASHLANAATVLWNGPMGVFEVAGFEGGTFGVARAVAEAADRGATVIVAGGDCAAAARSAGVAARMSHISTGGGAALDLLAGNNLPGVAALSDRLRGEDTED